MGAGPVRVVRNITQLDPGGDGDILVAQNTDPDWEPVMRRVAAIVNDARRPYRTRGDCLTRVWHPLHRRGR